MDEMCQNPFFCTQILPKIHMRNLEIQYPLSHFHVFHPKASFFWEF